MSKGKKSGNKKATVEKVLLATASPVHLRVIRPAQQVVYGAVKVVGDFLHLIT